MVRRLALLSILCASPLAAQPPAPRVIEIDPIVVEGRRQAPAAFYVLHRSELGSEVTDLRTTFVRRIIESVRRSPL